MSGEILEIVSPAHHSAADVLTSSKRKKSKGCCVDESVIRKPETDESSSPSNDEPVEKKSKELDTEEKKGEEYSSEMCSGIKNLTALIWGAHNSTMTPEERHRYLAEPPEWPVGIRKIIVYETDPQPSSNEPEGENHLEG